MELDTMRRALAEACDMPNEFDLSMSSVNSPIWGAYCGGYVYAKTRGGSLCNKWRPDEDWQQCGLVIEAMRRDGWEWYIRDNSDDTVYVEVRRDEGAVKAAEGCAEHADERHARMLCAARALQGEVK